MTSPPTVLTFGEALVGYASVEDNLRAATQFTRFPGGADLNVAVGLTRLGIRTTWASVLGDDAHGDYLADAVGQLRDHPAGAQSRRPDRPHVQSRRGRPVIPRCCRFATTLRSR